MSTQPVTEAVLVVNGLRVDYQTPGGMLTAVNDASLVVRRGEIVGLAGESGCGKTTLAMGILRLVQPPGRIVGGRVVVDGVDVTAAGDRQLRDLRWRKVALIPQGAMNSLNPVMRVRSQIADAIVTHEGRQPRAALKARILELLRSVGLPDRVYDLYPHELSGGMKQRACIAMAIALHPSLILADEPTSALDVVVQRIVAQTLLDIRARMGVGMIVIGHDMGLMAQLVDRLAIMYAGNMVEIAPVRSIFKEPRHPYTRLLIEAIPSIKERKPFQRITRSVHDLRQRPAGCIFQYRCPRASDRCRESEPPLREVESRHHVACHLCEDD